ncbi:MAG: imidazoleglycerol-phosphate dehydratase HisB [Clostridiales bacterium]|nr:imidazoleglycerol-phosphate dehydratase HisB [Clostridiales bacterium]
MSRICEINRKTKETDITLSLSLEGGEVCIETGIGFFDHMLTSFAVHSGFGLKIKAIGDLNVDCHHTVEDVGIVLGQALKSTVGDKKGIKRFGSSFVPMDDALCFCALDISGRAYLVYNATFQNVSCGSYETAMTKEFMYAVATNAMITLHLKCEYGDNDHHKTEGLYKAFARALKEAVKLEGETILSSKGTL